MVYLVILLLTSLFSPLLGDEIRFTQCECLADAGFTALSLAGDNNLENLADPAVTQTGNFACGALDSNMFPINNGVFFDGASGKSLSATLQQSYFDGDIVIGARITGGNANINTFTDVIDLNLANDNILQVRDDRIRFRADENNDVDFTVTNGDFIVVFGVINANAARDITFLCVSDDDGSAIDVTCDVNQQNVGFVAAGADTAATLLSGTNSFPMTLRQLLFFNDTSIDVSQVLDGANNVVDAASIEASVENFIQANFPSTIVVPALDEDKVPLTILEDITSDINLFDALLADNDDIEFTLIEGQLPDAGVVGAESNGIFNFDPDLNVNGDFNFQVTYGLSSINCFNTNAGLTLSIIPQNDAPTIDNDFLTQTVFAAADTIFESLLVATDVDQLNEVLTDGVLTIDNIDLPPSADDGFFVNFIDGVCGSDAETVFPLAADGTVSFCFRTPVGISSAEDTVEVSFTVTDGGAPDESPASTVGTMILTGDIPVAVGENVIDVITEEREERSFDLTSLGRPQVATVDFSIIFDSLPTEFGTFNIDENVVFAKETEVIFTPNNGVFNAVDNLGQGQDERDIDTFGEITASYRVILEGTEFTTDPVDLVFIINAFDDGSPTIVAAEDEILETFVEGTLSADVLLPSFDIQSDNGESVFDVRLLITTSGGATIVLSADSDRDGTLEFVNEQNAAGNSVENCVNFDCSNVEIRGTPNQLSEVLAESRVRLNLVEQSVPLINFDIIEDNQIFRQPSETVTYVVEFREAGFFEDSTNVGAVAGGSAAFVLLVVGFTVFRVRSRSNKMTKHRLQAAESKVQEEIMRGKLREPDQQGAKSHRKASRNKKAPEVSADAEDEVEDVGNGWEKHFDSKSKEYFYHNPSTGKTQWTLPDDLEQGGGNGSRQGRIQTIDLNL